MNVYSMFLSYNTLQYNTIQRTGLYWGPLAIYVHKRAPGIRNTDFWLVLSAFFRLLFAKIDEN